MPPEIHILQLLNRINNLLLVSDRLVMQIWLPSLTLRKLPA